MRRTAADRDPTGETAVGRVMREQEAHADLGLGYPPDDDTEDLWDVSDTLSLTSIPDRKSEGVASELRPVNSKKPSTTSTAKHLVEGVQINNHKEADHL